MRPSSQRSWLMSEAVVMREPRRSRRTPERQQGQPPGAVCGQQEHGVSGHGGSRQVRGRARGANPRLPDPQQRLLVPEVHFDAPAPQVSLQDLIERKRRVCADQVSRLAIEKPCALPRAIGSGGSRSRAGSSFAPVTRQRTRSRVLILKVWRRPAANASTVCQWDRVVLPRVAPAWATPCPYQRGRPPRTEPLEGLTASWNRASPRNAADDCHTRRHAFQERLFVNRTVDVIHKRPGSSFFPSLPPPRVSNRDTARRLMSAASLRSAPIVLPLLGASTWPRAIGRRGQREVHGAFGAAPPSSSGTAAAICRTR
jgi:hypothetical protein